MMRDLTLSLVVAFAVYLSIDLASAQQPYQVEWRVVDRYRLFLSDAQAAPLQVNDGSTSPQDALLEKLASRLQEINSSEGVYTTIVDFLTARQNIGGVVDLPYRRTHWRNREAAPERLYDAEYLYPGSYIVAARLDGAAGSSCIWRAGDAEVRTGCDQGVRLAIPADPTGSGSQTVLLTATVADGASVSERITVRDRLIASFGESFASGEGNPDIPQDMAGLDSGPSEWQADFRNRWWLQERSLERVELAQWMDGWCHRSLFSQHLVASLVYASRHPHEATSFVSFACSGASVENGIVYPQRKPPGFPEFGDPPHQLTQIEALQEIRCRNDVSFDRTEAARLLARYASSEDKIFKPRRLAREGTGVAAQCVDGRSPRPVDALLISMGGNDVGFAGTIMDTILPSEVSDPAGKVALRWTRRILNAQTLQEAQPRLARLPDRFEAQRLLIRQAFGDVLVVHSAYPNPLRVGETVCGGGQHDLMLEALAGTYPDKYVNIEDRWPFRVEQARAEQAERMLVNPLNGLVSALTATDPRWRLNAGFDGVFRTRGWCAGSGATTAFPNWDDQQRAWMPGAPSGWRAYESRERLFRTPNDAALTQVASRRKLGRWVISLREGAIRATAGAFHPTFEGHTVMGISSASVLENALQ